MEPGRIQRTVAVWQGWRWLVGVAGLLGVALCSCGLQWGGEMKGTELTDAQKRYLLALARETVETFLTEGYVPQIKPTDERLMAHEGAFVTLRRKNGELRGCIGNIVSDQPLYKTVQEMAVAAAVHDPRFPAMTADEIPDMVVEVSVLSPPKKIDDPNLVEPGRHGVILRRGPHQGVFLPKVATEWGWDRETFLSQLAAHKAGLPPDAWKDPETELYIFTAQEFSEKDFAGKE